MKISIIIRSFNEERFIGDLLISIRNQIFEYDYEVILVDSGSNDQTISVASKFSFVKIFRIKKEEFTYGYSLNYGIRNSVGSIIVVLSAHTMPCGKFFLKKLVDPIIKLKYQISYGRQTGNKLSRSSEVRLFNELFSANLVTKYKYPNNACMAFKKELWVNNHFDEEILALEDLDFSLKIKSQYIKYVPKAKIYHIHLEENCRVFQRFFRESYAYHKKFSHLDFAHFKVDNFFLFFLAHEIFFDFLYLFKNKKFLKGFKGVIGYRISQYYGLYLGKNITKLTNEKIHKYLLFLLYKDRLNFEKINFVY